MIRLIINADDFGYSPRFNRAILELLEKDFIKSTTVMVKRVTKDQDKQIEQLSKIHHIKKISVGLHLELDMWQKPQQQMEEQYKMFVKIFGFAPDHLDVHKLVDSKDVIKEVNKFAEKHKMPVRNHGVSSSAPQTTYPALHCKSLSARLDEITSFLHTVKDESICELITHPGEYDPNSTPSLNRERETDYKTITQLQEFIKQSGNIENVSYLELSDK